jgi:peptide chain release factor 2
MLQEVKNKIEELKAKIENLGTLLDIEKKRKRVGELEQESAKPGLWQNQKEAQKILQELKLTEEEIRNFEVLRAKCDDLLVLTDAGIKDEDEEIEKEINVELKDLEGQASSLEVKTLLGESYDKNNAILTINAGAGGTDAQDWANILLRMYSRYADGKGYKVEMPEISYGEEAGIKSVTLVLSGPYAYGYIKGEKGVHRLVRLSPFNADSKRHTSFASVDVIPEITEDIEVKINPVDLKVDTYRASGPGGQHVNKTDSAVRITHIPTKIVAQSQSDRSQHANREAAMKILKARLHERLLKEQKEKIEELRGELKEIGWGNQIRSYVFHPYNMVKDHRTGTETSSVNKVVDGDIDIFIESYLRGQKNQEG